MSAIAVRGRPRARESVVHFHDLWHNRTRMIASVLPYGRAGRIERTRLVERLIAERQGPPFLYDDVLILVPASRMRRLYGALFLDALNRLRGGAALVQPPVLTLPQFASRLFEKSGGPQVLDENARLVLLEGIVKELMTGNADFGVRPDVVAPSLSAAVAATIEQLASAGVSPERLSSAPAADAHADRPQFKLLVEAFTRYERTLAARGLTDPAGMFAALAEGFDPAWLAPYSLIVIDGIFDVDELQARLLVKIANHGNCRFLVDAPSPAGIEKAGPSHPLAPIREYLGRLGLAPSAGGEEASPEDRFLGEALFSERAFDETAADARGLPSFLKDVRLLSAVNMREEVGLIAAGVKTSLRRGARPDAILVTFPALDEYGPLAEEIFTDYGIPYTRALGRQLSASPVAAAVISLLRAAQEDYSGPALLRVLGSPFLTFAGRPSLAGQLDRVLRRQRITGGREKVLAAVSREQGEDENMRALGAALAELFDALAPFSDTAPASLAEWMDRLARLMNRAGAAERVDAIKGPLNVNLQAFHKLTETLDSLKRAGGLFPGYRYTCNEWTFLVRKTLMHARFQVPPEDEGGVQLLGLEESAGRAWEEIYFGGLVDAQFPQRLPQNIFLPEASLEALGVRAIERARLLAAHSFYRLLLSAPRVTLTRPESAGDRPVAPSPFLLELEPLRRAGLVNRGLAKTSGLQFSLSPGDARSLPELAKALSLAGADGLPALPELPELRAVTTALARRGANPAPATPREKREFSVTELDVYLRCPYDYYVTRVLGLAPMEEVSEDISPQSRGSVIHGILRDFYRAWNKPVAADSLPEARALLEKLAASAFRRTADTFRNFREQELFLSVMAERFLAAELEFWKQGMKPVFLEEIIEKSRITLPDGEDVFLTAKIDRIDADDRGNFIVVDYKTGGYPQPRMNREQDIFQLPVYAVLAERAFAGRTPALAKPIGLAYYDLAGKYGAGARDVALFDKDARDDHPAAKPRASAKTSEDFRAVLDASMEKAAAAIKGIRSGAFPSQPRDENVCRFCPNEMMCEPKT